jgi:hypothetical protein
VAFFSEGRGNVLRQDLFLFPLMQRTDPRKARRQLLQHQTSKKTDPRVLPMHMMTTVETERRVAYLLNAKTKAKTNIKNNVKNQC